MFHVIKHGLGRESAASVLLLLCTMTYFDWPGETKNLPDRLHRAYMTFKMWCLTAGKTPSLKNFTRANLHVTGSPFPYLGGKGSDTTMVLTFLQFFLKLCKRDMRDGSDENVLRGMMQLTDGLLNFTSMQYSHDLWLPRECAEFMYLQGLVALRSYGYLARHCMGLGKRFFGMRPKFHLLAETVFELKSCVTLGHTWILSPVIYNCEVNEDFIGRVSRISRHVSSRTVVLRTLQRYGVAFRARLRRLKPRSSKISKAMTCKEKANAKHLVDHHVFCKFALLPFFWNVIFLYPLLPFLPEKTFVSKILRHGVSRYT